MKHARGIWISFTRGPDIRLGAPEFACDLLPDGAASDVRTKSGDLRRVARYGIVDFKTASGDAIDDASADAFFKSASGDVHIDDRRRVPRRAVGVRRRARRRRRGDATLQNSFPATSTCRRSRLGCANTVSGDQRYEAVVRGRLELRAVSGDIGVAIRRGSRVFIDANTVSGSTSSEFDLSDAPAAPRLSRKRRLSLTPPSSRSTRRPSRATFASSAPAAPLLA